MAVVCHSLSGCPAGSSSATTDKPGEPGGQLGLSHPATTGQHLRPGPLQFGQHHIDAGASGRREPVDAGPAIRTTPVLPEND
jgi:hypothetical protein